MRFTQRLVSGVQLSLLVIFFRVSVCAIKFASQILCALQCVIDSLFTYLCSADLISPSSSHWNCGGGDPVAEHLRETCGPGLRACSMNVY